MHSDNALIVQWLGDISLNGPFCDPQHAAALRKNLESVAAELGPCDLRIANWESPLWGDGGVNELKTPRLATTIGAATAAEPLKLDVVLLANNHVYDCLACGFDNSVLFLQEMGAAIVGAGRSIEDAAKPLTIERHGLRVGLLNYVAYDTHPNLPPDASVFLNWFEEQRALAEVDELRKKADVVLVHLHWGDEFVRIPTVDQRRLARKLIDAGARVVVGCHGHTLQGHEPWGVGHIFHGIGNFLFWPPSQASDASRSWPRYVREVGVASCQLTSGGVYNAFFRHLVQEGVSLKWDETPKRKRAERRLCLALRLRDSWFKRVGQIDSFYRLQFVFRRHSMKEAGGIGPWIAGAWRRWRRRQR